jgi:cytochrome c
MPRVLSSFAVAALIAAAAAPALADEALAKARGCMACHAVGKKFVGPAYKDVARKYAADAGAADKLAAKITQGSTGVWGPLSMPPNAAVKEADAKKLAGWILSLQ